MQPGTTPDRTRSNGGGRFLWVYHGLDVLFLKNDDILINHLYKNTQGPSRFNVAPQHQRRGSPFDRPGLTPGGALHSVLKGGALGAVQQIKERM